jgi:hypothetical protein
MTNSGNGEIKKKKSSPGASTIFAYLRKLILFFVISFFPRATQHSFELRKTTGSIVRIPFLLQNVSKLSRRKLPCFGPKFKHFCTK